MSTGTGGDRGARHGGSGLDPGAEPGVADLFGRLNLTEEEGEFAAFSDDEDEGSPAATQWAVVGKVLSPSTIHATTIKGAMQPAWGNPCRLNVRSIGEKVDNLFIAEFGDKFAMERALEGSPWLIGKHAVILRDYDDRLVPSEITFDKIDLWVRMLNLPLGWMNAPRGRRAMGLMGEVKKMDVDGDGKASGPFLRARVAVDLAKPLRRGVLLKTDRSKPPDWFDIQYEKLPFFCHSCGIMGHGDLECVTPAQRNALGKLPYDIALRAPENKKKKLQGLAQAAAETFGSSSSSTARQQRRSASTEEKNTATASGAHETKGGEREILSPLKRKVPEKEARKEKPLNQVRQNLFSSKEGENPRKTYVKKRKVKGHPNDPVTSHDRGPTLVPNGTVQARLSELAGNINRGGKDSEELPKKQGDSSNARSAAAADDSPRRAQ